MKRPIVSLLIFFLLALSVLPAWAEHSLRLGVIAFRPKTQTLEQWQPLAAYLETALGQPVELKVYEYTEMAAAISRSEVDVVLSYPALYIQLKHRYGLSAPVATLIATDGRHELAGFGGVIFTRADAANINSLADLAGKRFAAVSTEAWGGYQMQAFELLEAGLKLPQKDRLLITGQPHDNVVAAVLSGRADAGFVRSGLLETMAREQKLDLRNFKVINRQNLPDYPYASSTPLYPEWCVSVLPQVDEHAALRLTVALLSLSPDNIAARTAAIHGFTVPANYDGVEKVMRRLRMPPFDVLPEFTISDLWNKYTGWIVALFGMLLLLAGSGVWLLVQNRTIRQSKIRLDHERQHLHTLIETMPDLVWLKNGDGTFMECNLRFETLLGARKDDIIGKNDYDFFDHELADFFKAHDNAAIENNGSTTNEELVTFADGHSELLETTKTPMYDSNGELIGVLGIGHDITERKQAEEEKAKLEGQLHQSQKIESVGRLAGGVAHDFNNMLSVILGHAEMSLMRIDQHHPMYTSLTEIHKAAGRSADLTRQLLAFARKQTVAPRVINLNETVAGMLSMLQRLIGENMHLTWQPGANLWPVMMDCSQIDQILANLCVNARDAIVDIGRIAIETENCVIDENYCKVHPYVSPGEYIKIVVSDNGSGMDRETQEHIFEPFFTTKEVGVGTGLGLATVYGIVRQNNGFITVDSEPGSGTTFTIYLPRHEGSSDKSKAEGATEKLLRGNETILLVEDEPAIMEITTLILEDLGYTVLKSGAPDEAIRLAREHAGEIHLVITDVIMPAMNGKVLANTLLTFKPQIKCLFMSGYTADIIAPHGVLDEGVHFIHKPFNLADMATKVREVLDSDNN